MKYPANIQCRNSVSIIDSNFSTLPINKVFCIFV
uniref:Uncharacterized protein n=1 Tax=Anguilla anguilla TaxID=7936 RepID=A0A0E9T5H6_ANGAN